ncbi:MAG: DMT family transporter [Lactobacillus sp.]|jgi:drug/metabolite transporter (DMT)-like permease|nr:DMT family transporter [Lactobacillus sp.]
MLHQNKALVGILLASVGATFWGISGVIAQHLFESLPISPFWLTSVRLLGSGLLLFGYCLITRRDLWSIWKSRANVIALLLFTVFGVIMSQYTYFVAVHFTNAATATVLQFTGPIFITLWLLIFKRQLPNFIEVIAIILTILGTYLLVTHGNSHHLVISPLALFWGLLSGVAVATNTLLPVKLLEHHPPLIVMTWAMLLGGIIFNGIQPFWRTSIQLSGLNLAAIGFVVIFGTLLAYVFYLTSLKFISTTLASILDAFEPLSATILAVTVLGVSFTVSDLVGSSLIVITVLCLIAVNHRQEKLPHDSDEST